MFDAKCVAYGVCSGGPVGGTGDGTNRKQQQIVTYLVTAADHTFLLSTKPTIYTKTSQTSLTRSKYSYDTYHASIYLFQYHNVPIRQLPPANSATGRDKNPSPKSSGISASLGASPFYINGMSFQYIIICTTK